TNSPVGRLEDLLDLGVNPPSGLLTVLARGHRWDIEKERLARLLERRQSQCLAHPVAGDHVTRHVGGPLTVVLRSRRDVAAHELLSDAAAEQHVEPIPEFGAWHEVPILRRLLLRAPERGRPPGA